MRSQRGRQSSDPEQPWGETTGDDSTDVRRDGGGRSHDDGANEPVNPDHEDSLGNGDGSDIKEYVADGSAELDDEQEAASRPPTLPGWPVIQLDVGLLQDPDGDPEGHRAEWRRVYETFDPHLRNYFANWVSYDDAQDVIGEVWSRASRRIRSLDQPSKMVFWLIKIGRNVLNDQRKAEVRRLERQRKYVDDLETLDGDWRDAVLDRLSGEHLFDGRIDRHDFRREFAKLSDMNQEFAYQLQVEGISHRALVVHFGLSTVDASKSRWQWIRRKLKKALDGNAAEAPVPPRVR